jgi:hypothetical protein
LDRRTSTRSILPADTTPFDTISPSLISRTAPISNDTDVQSGPVIVELEPMLDVNNELVQNYDNNELLPVRSPPVQWVTVLDNVQTHEFA